jgi:uncharacterized protein YebE (UPF0316 family)
MNQEKLKMLFIFTIIIIILIFSVVLSVFNNIEGMVPYAMNYNNRL